MASMAAFVFIVHALQALACFAYVAFGKDEDSPGERVRPVALIYALWACAVAYWAWLLFRGFAA